MEIRVLYLLSIIVYLQIFLISKYKISILYILIVFYTVRGASRLQSSQ